MVMTKYKRKQRKKTDDVYNGIVVVYGGQMCKMECNCMNLFKNQL